jgi:predicted methyltransferase
MRQHAAVAALACLLALAGCDRNDGSREDGAGSGGADGAPLPVPDIGTAPAPQEAIAAAIASPARLTGDADQDTWRKPEVILDVLGVESGMEVIDVFAAGGYYTELLARAVGPLGRVIAYNNAPYAQFAGAKLEERYGGARLPNVEQLTVPVNELVLAPASLDAALFVMSYHDLYWRPDDGSWPETDPAELLASLYVGLRPGGVVVVQDHVANPGVDPVTGVGELHRIDPEIVKRDFARAGFVFDGGSEALRHPDDDHTLSVFDPSIRQRTDQFIYRFVKPAGEGETG